MLRFQKNYIRYAGFQKHKKTKTDIRKQLGFLFVIKAKCFFMFSVFSFVFLKTRSVPYPLGGRKGG